MFDHLKIFFSNERSFSVGSVFFCMGLLFGSWVTQIPYIKAKFQMNDAQLGLLLLSMPLGTTLLGPFISKIISHFGILKLTVFGAFLMAVAYALPVNMPEIWLVSLTLSLVGASIALTNVAMNACAIEIEQREGIFIMSACHGMFSIGGMFGASVASIFTGWGVSSRLQMLGAASLVLLIVFLVRPVILALPQTKKIEAENTSTFKWPTGVLLNLVLISFCTNVTEGTMADWTAVFMREVVHANVYFVGWGFAGYAFFMALGRFMGDKVIPRFGYSKILVFSGLTCATGICLAVGLPYTPTSILGFSLVGVGVSCCAPILYSCAMNIPNMAQGAGLATMNSFSLMGFLAGPAILGFLSNTFSLPLAIGSVSFLCIFWVFMAKKTEF